MASLFVVSVDAVALVAATAKSVFEIAADANHPVKIVQWWVEFDGVDPTKTPVKVEFGKFSAAVTTATSITPLAIDGTTAVAQSTTKHSTSTEGAGTASTGIPIHRVSPTAGYGEQGVLGRELVVVKAEFLRMRLTAATAVNATFGVVFEE